jgi:hypothetical protein
VGWVRDNSHVVFGQKFSVKKEVRDHCHNARASSFVTKVHGKVLTHVHAVAIKCQSSMRN